MGKKFIADTANVLFKRKSDGHAVFTAEAQIAGISSAVTEDIIRGGIGNKALFISRHSKEVTLNVQNAAFDLEWLAMTQGVSITESSATVSKVEEGLTVADNAGTGEVTISGTPSGSTVTLRNADGETEETSVATNAVTVPTGFASEGEKVDVIYTESVTGKVVTIDSAKFSESYEVQYSTIEYDGDSNKVVNDIYFQFDNVLPQGSFDISFENGSAVTPTLNFNALAGANGEIGRIIEAPRA